VESFFVGGERVEVALEQFQLVARPEPPRCAHRLLGHRDLGISSCRAPSSSRPCAFGVRPPHCLKKKATPASRHWSRIDRTQSVRHPSSVAAALSAGDHPVDPGGQFIKWAEERLAERTDGGWHGLKVPIRKSNRPLSTLTPIHRFGGQSRWLPSARLSEAIGAISSAYTVGWIW